jgi:hypothetical protein
MSCRVPKELISRFVKLCPTCQTRRGTNRDEPIETSPKHEASDVTSPEMLSPPPSRRESTIGGLNSVGPSLSFQQSFKTTAAWSQQNRWMTPAQPGGDQDNLSPISTQGPIHRSDHYNTIPPLSCTTASGPSYSFASSTSYGSNHTSPGYTSSTLSQSSHGHVPTHTGYSIKMDTTYA